MADFEHIDHASVTTAMPEAQSDVGHFEHDLHGVGHACEVGCDHHHAHEHIDLPESNMGYEAPRHSCADCAPGAVHEHIDTGKSCEGGTCGHKHHEDVHTHVDYGSKPKIAELKHTEHVHEEGCGHVEHEKAQLHVDRTFAHNHPAEAAAHVDQPTIVAMARGERVVHPQTEHQVLANELAAKLRHHDETLERARGDPILSQEPQKLIPKRNPDSLPPKVATNIKNINTAVPTKEKIIPAAPIEGTYSRELVEDIVLPAIYPAASGEFAGAAITPYEELLELPIINRPEANRDIVAGLLETDVMGTPLEDAAVFESYEPTPTETIGGIPAEFVDNPGYLDLSEVVSTEAAATASVLVLEVPGMSVTEDFETALDAPQHTVRAVPAEFGPIAPQEFVQEAASLLEIAETIELLQEQLQAGNTPLPELAKEIIKQLGDYMSSKEKIELLEYAQLANVAGCIGKIERLQEKKRAGLFRENGVVQKQLTSLVDPMLTRIGRLVVALLQLGQQKMSA